MLGTIREIEQYWSTGTDLRELHIEQYSWGMNSIEIIGNDGRLPEYYFSRAFLEGLVFNLATDLGDYWRFLRDLFIVVNDCWFDFFWFKRPNYDQPLAVGELVNHQFWQTLFFGIQPNTNQYLSDLTAARHTGAIFNCPDTPPKID